MQELLSPSWHDGEPQQKTTVCEGYCRYSACVPESLNKRQLCVGAVAGVFPVRPIDGMSEALRTFVATNQLVGQPMYQLGQLIR